MTGSAGERSRESLTGSRTTRTELAGIFIAASFVRVADDALRTGSPVIVAQVQPYLKVVAPLYSIEPVVRVVSRPVAEKVETTRC